MLGTGTARRGEWMLVLLRSPGEQPIARGVLLLDLATDRLYVRLTNDIVDLDPDVTVVWELLESDLVDKAAEMGGANVMRWLEDEGSNTISAGDRRELQMTRPEMALDELYSCHVELPMKVSGGSTRVESQRAFNSSDLAAAREKLPISKVVGIRALKTLQEPRSSFQQVGEVLAKDPVLSAHLIRLGNLASVSRGGEVRSVRQALTRIGSDEAKLHIWGLCTKNLYSSPHLQQIWNHSLLTVNVITELCEETGYSDAPSAKLIAMLHDIGQLVLSALGPSYQALRAKLLAEGLYEVEMERKLCGATHAELGGDLLSLWQFPNDLIEAVRHHHNPSRSESILTSLLYCAESWTDRGEDIYNPVEHEHAIELLGLQGSKLHLGTRDNPNLHLLRFAV